MVCNLIDFKCVIVNELIGDPILTVLILAIFYFIVAAKLKFGFDTTIFLAIPVMIAIGLAVAGMQAIYVFFTFLAGIVLALILLRVMGNR